MRGQVCPPSGKVRFLHGRFAVRVVGKNRYRKGCFVEALEDVRFMGKNGLPQLFLCGEVFTVGCVANLKRAPHRLGDLKRTQKLEGSV